MTTNEYLKYLIEPFSSKSIVLFATFNAFIVSISKSIELHLGISAGLFVFYFIMALIDFISGYYKNCVHKDDKFKSELFFKKIAQICAVIISLYGFSQLTIWVQDVEVPNVAIKEFQNTIVYLFSLFRIFLVVSFLSYELTSIKENADEIGWNKVSDIISITILPLTWIKDKIKSKK